MLALIGSGLLLAVSGGSAFADGNANIWGGQKELDQDFSNDENVSEQDALAVLLDFGRDTWPVHISLDVLSSSQDSNDNDFDVNFDGSTTEVDLGARWYLNKDDENSFRPYLGGGLAYIAGEVDTDAEEEFLDVEFDDNGIGYFVNGGLGWRLGESFNVGADVRWAKAELNVDQGLDDTADIDAGGLSYGVFFGFGW
jgi:opacity protein-like surface antigen